MKSTHLLCLAAVSGILLTVSSCTVGNRSPSGFLPNYSQLDTGYGTADTIAAYMKPGVDFKKYDSVMIEPVTTVIYSSGVSPQATAQLAAYLEESLRSQAMGKLKVVSTPGVSTLRIRTALTDVVEGNKKGKPVRTVHVNPRATLEGKLGSAELASFISNVCFEGEILDSVSGERLSAITDHRIGAKREAAASTSWAAVHSAAHQGASRMLKRIVAARES